MMSSIRRRFALVLAMLIVATSLTGCDLRAFTVFRLGKTAVGKVNDTYNDASDRITNESVDASKLTAENKANGRRAAFESEGFFTKMLYRLRGILSLGTSAEELYEKDNKSKVLVAQKTDYLNNNASLEEYNAVRSKTTKQTVRQLLLNILPFALIAVIVMLLVYFFKKYISSNKVKRPKKMRKEALKQPPPIVPAAPVARTGDVSVNYARGRRFHCKEHGLDYDSIVTQYGSEEAAFKALVSKT